MNKSLVDDITIEPTDRLDIITSLMTKILEHYVFPNLAESIVDTMRDHLNQGHYDHLTSASELCSLLTEHLQEASRDKHLRVRLHDDERSGNDPEHLKKIERRILAQNFGFYKVDRLQGNIGYIELGSFAPAELAGETLVHAMGFVANTDALVIDLRENGGGVPSMICLFCSYLLPEEPVHLNSFYWRPSNETQQFWTFPFIPGKRYLGKPVYVLTSNRTFSGAEEFAYDLKNLKRATIVGERTGGGAHPGMDHPLTDYIDVFIPAGRAINPITNGNWEGEGVEPDIVVSEDDALRVAHVHALREIRDSKTDMSEFQLFEIRNALQSMDKDVD